MQAHVYTYHSVGPAKLHGMLYVRWYILERYSLRSVNLFIICWFSRNVYIYIHTYILNPANTHPDEFTHGEEIKSIQEFHSSTLNRREHIQRTYFHFV